MIAKAYHKLKNNSDMKLSVHFFHYNNSSEPFMFAESDIENIVLDHIKDVGLSLSIITPEIVISIDEPSWNLHVGEDYITFASIKDVHTHIVVEFC